MNPRIHAALIRALQFPELSDEARSVAVDGLSGMTYKDMSTRVYSVMSRSHGTSLNYFVAAVLATLGSDYNATCEYYADRILTYNPSHEPPTP